MANKLTDVPAAGVNTEVELPTEEKSIPPVIKALHSPPPDLKPNIVTPPANPQERTLCYLCGTILDDSNRTMDHIPPKGLFPRPLPNNLLTIPCCRQCNNGFSRDDEFFRLIATLGLHKSPEKTLVYETRTVPRTLARRRIRSEIRSLLSGMKRQWIEVNGVMVYAGLFRLPVDLIRRVTTRIAQGLLAFQHPTLATHNLHYDTYVQPKHDVLLRVIAEIGPDLTEARLGGKTFHTYYGTVPDQPKYGMSLMCFHETISAAVFHFPDESSTNTVPTM